VPNVSGSFKGHQLVVLVCPSPARPHAFSSPRCMYVGMYGLYICVLCYVHGQFVPPALRRRISCHLAPTTPMVGGNLRQQGPWTLSTDRPALLGAPASHTNYPQFYRRIPPLNPYLPGAAQCRSPSIII
jgi:hypothetical protein